MWAGERVGRGRAMVGAVLWAVLGVAVRATASEGEHGWSWLIDRLSADGVPRATARAVFLDPRMEPFDGMTFGLAPRESHAMYRGHLSRTSVLRARRCRAEHLGALREAEAIHGVSADVVAAIIQVESACGANTGSARILPPLARLAMAREPENLERNLAAHSAGLSGEAREEAEARTLARAQALDDMFYPQVRATFEVARRLGVDPLGLRGSGGGAFGIPQFLPASYLEYGRDGDGDGHVSLYDPADAIHSCARYLAAHGWRPGLSRAERRRVIWTYNHSDAYIDTVLALADRLGGPDEPEPVRVASGGHGKHRAGGTRGRHLASGRHTRPTRVAMQTRGRTKHGAVRARHAVAKGRQGTTPRTAKVRQAASPRTAKTRQGTSPRTAKARQGTSPRTAKARQPKRPS